MTPCPRCKGCGEGADVYDCNGNWLHNKCSQCDGGAFIVAEHKEVQLELPLQTPLQAPLQAPLQEREVA